MSARASLLVWAALMALLALTIAITFLPIGSAKTYGSVTIAFVKAALVFWFFMHLRRERGLVRIAAVAGGVWLTILLILASVDPLTRAWFGAAL